MKLLKGSNTTALARVVKPPPLVDLEFVLNPPLETLRWTPPGGVQNKKVGFVHESFVDDPPVTTCYRPPLAAMGQGRRACDTPRVPQSVHPQRAAPERVVGTRVVRTYSHAVTTMAPSLAVQHPVRRRRTADARRVRMAYGQLTPLRVGLARGACSLAAPRRHRRPHSSHTDRQLT